MKFNPHTEEIIIGSNVLVISALPAGPMVYQVLPLTTAMAAGEMDMATQLDKLAPIVAQSLGYADPVTAEEIVGTLPFADILELFFAILKISGAQRGKAETATNPKGPASSPD